MDDKYVTFQAVLDADPEYLAFRQANLSTHTDFQELLRVLEPHQKEVLYEYLGTLAEMQMREIELALMLE